MVTWRTELDHEIKTEIFKTINHLVFNQKNDFELIKQPGNILIDYTEKAGKVTDLPGLVISDWGTSGVESEHYGGTPVYASGNCFNKSGQKDIFAFGQIAAELFLEQSGN